MAVVIMVLPAEPPEAAPADAGAPVAGVPAPDELLLEHAATSSTVPTAATTPAASLSPVGTSATAARSLAPILAALPPGPGASFLAVIKWPIVLSSQLRGRLMP
jgi:hypothetical protein